MAVTYQKFLKQNISLENVGVIRRTDNEAYFCTPKGASIFGWAGVDGIHYCKIRGFGEMIFAISPMNCAGEYVHPLAENFEDFLRLLLFCGDAAVLEQAWQWNEVSFKQFLADNPVTEEQRETLAQITEKLHLTPMEDAWQYLSHLQSSFDYSRIRFTEDYYDEDMNADAPKVIPEWKVTFTDSFRSRERAGKEIVIDKQFMWAERQWIIPAVYSCGKGLVVDFCMKIPPEKIQAFMNKWDLNIENESYRQFTKEEQMLIESDNPLSFNFNPQAILNGKQLLSSRGRGSVYNPCIPEGYTNESEAIRIADHYGMDLSYGWMFWRSYFPWNTTRKPEIKSLEIIMEQQKVAVPGLHFRVNKAGDTITFAHPDTGVEYKLTVQEYEKLEMDMEHIFGQDLEYPTHYYQMAYTIEPEMENGVMTVADCAEGDRPRPKEATHDPYHPVAAASIGIIGGADGPIALIIGNRSAKLNIACSSLHYEPVEEIEWRMVFHEKQYEDGKFKLL